MRRSKSPKFRSCSWRARFTPACRFDSKCVIFGRAFIVLRTVFIASARFLEIQICDILRRLPNSKAPEFSMRPGILAPPRIDVHHLATPRTVYSRMTSGGRRARQRRVTLQRHRLASSGCPEVAGISFGFVVTKVLKRSLIPINAYAVCVGARHESAETHQVRTSIALRLRRFSRIYGIARLPAVCLLASNSDRQRPGFRRD